MTTFQETWTNPAYPYGSYTLLSSNNGLFRFWNVQAPMGMDEVLTTSLAGWTRHPESTG